MGLALQLGAAKVDITPPAPVPLAGFAPRSGPFSEVLHPLSMRVLFFQQDGPAGSRRALVVSADLLCWGSEWVPQLRERLRKTYGLEEAAIVLHATHNHSGPQTSSLFTPSMGVFEPRYFALLETALLNGVARAAETLEPVFIDRGAGRCDFAVNRRKRVGDKIVLAPNPDGPIDPHVSVVRFRTGSGSTKALLIHCTCHPNTTGDNFVSPEFPGIAMEQLEASLDKDTVAVFLQGCCGDVRPALVRGDAFYRGGDEEVCRLGSQLAAEGRSVIERPMLPCSPCPLAAKRTEVLLAFDRLPSRADLETGAAEPGIAGEWSRFLLEHPERIQPNISLELVNVDLAKELSLLAFNAEMVVEYGLFVKRAFAGRVLPLAYSNGMIGYVTTAMQLDEGGYEPNESFLYYGLPGRFRPSAEELVYKTIMQVVD